MKVSILVPSFNHARFLPECLKSIQAQTYGDWEAIVVDDRSTDGSHEVALGFAARDPRIQAFLNNSNRGTYGTQQAALERAPGEAIAILNSDDYWMPEKLAVQVALLEAHPAATFAYSLGQTVDENGQPFRTQNQHADWPTVTHQSLLPFLLGENRVLASSVLFRRGGLRFHSDLRYSGDWVALMEMAQKGPAVFSNSFLSAWRQHGENSYQRSKGQVLEEIRVRRAIADQAPDWEGRGVGELEWKQALARNRLHLQALYLFLGERRLARWAVGGAGAHPNRRHLVVRWLSNYLLGYFLRQRFGDGRSLGILPSEIARLEPLTIA